MSAITDALRKIDFEHTTALAELREANERNEQLRKHVDVLEGQVAGLQTEAAKHRGEIDQLTKIAMDLQMLCDRQAGLLASSAVAIEDLMREVSSLTPRDDTPAMQRAGNFLKKLGGSNA